MFSIAPVLNYLRSTAKQQDILIYSPTYTLYTPKTVLDSADTTYVGPGNTTALNSLNQSVDGIFQGQLSPRVTLRAGADGFVRTWNVLNKLIPVLIRWAWGLDTGTHASCDRAICETTSKSGDGICKLSVFALWNDRR